MPETILVIDDYGDDAVWLEMVLRKVGVTNPIQIKQSAVEAVSYLKGEFPYSDRAKYPLPKIIFLDLKMPGVDGFEFLVWLKAQNQLGNLTVFAVTGLEDILSIRKAYAMGATSFLVKPARPADILNLIHSFPSHWNLIAAPLPPGAPNSRGSDVQLPIPGITPET